MPAPKLQNVEAIVALSRTVAEGMEGWPDYDRLHLLSSLIGGMASVCINNDAVDHACRVKMKNTAGQVFAEMHTEVSYPEWLMLCAYLLACANQMAETGGQRE